MKLAIASDEFGLPLQTTVVTHIQEHHPDVDVTEFEPAGGEDCAYPDIAFPLAEAVARGEYDRGILICGTGAGMAICANKVPGVRAVVVHDPYTAERARKSNDAQVMAMGAQIVGGELAKSLVTIWLNSEFAGGRSLPKVQKIIAAEKGYQK